MAASSLAVKRNIVFLLTDDQDLMLGSMRRDGPMQNLMKHVVDKGANFTNAFAHTPICCPSRATIQTGRYMHTNGVPDNACGGAAFVDAKTGPERLNMAHYLKQAGYTSSYAGKYLNNYGGAEVGGMSRIPEGWDAWYGLKGNSKYYAYDVSRNGVTEHHGDDYTLDYFTDGIANFTLAFIANATRAKVPWFAMMGTPACHGPNEPAPQYATTYAEMESPRLPTWNKAPQPEKHNLLRHIVPMAQGEIDTSDVFFERRWSVLRSVDDLVLRVVQLLTTLEQLDNTYWVYTSDHGYHLGEFGMLYDKRMLYETDIRVPLYVAGPDIAPGQIVPGPVSHADLAPTVLALAGIDARVAAPQMDGRSWLSLVDGTRRSREGAEAAAAAVEEEEEAAAFAWRTDFVIEYGGPLVAADGITVLDEEDDDVIFHLHERGGGVAASGGAAPPLNCTANKTAATTACSCSCVYQASSTSTPYLRSPCDSKNNTYRCLRTMNATENSIYCEFDDAEHFVEYYDLSVDPYNVVNLAFNASNPAVARARWGLAPEAALAVAPGMKAKLAALAKRLLAYMQCKGLGCWDPKV
jgi:N-acetylglucosamine-6-sulfatase